MTFNDKISPALQQRMGLRTCLPGITCGVQPSKKWIGTEADSLLAELETATAPKQDCDIDCKCPPCEESNCEESNCEECLVEMAFKNGLPREEALAIKEQYRAASVARETRPWGPNG
jgi:hypothetical protein